MFRTMFVPCTQYCQLLPFDFIKRNTNGIIGCLHCVGLNRWSCSVVFFSFWIFYERLFSWQFVTFAFGVKLIFIEFSGNWLDHVPRFYSIFFSIDHDTLITPTIIKCENNSKLHKFYLRRANREQFLLYDPIKTWIMKSERKNNKKENKRELSITMSVLSYYSYAHCCELSRSNVASDYD